jgi:hypothetical protein
MDAATQIRGGFPMKAIQFGHEYTPPQLGWANGNHTFKLKLWALRVGVRWITSHKYFLDWFAFCPAPAGVIGFSVYVRRIGLGWRWEARR